jgi:hypothetical protein
VKEGRPPIIDEFTLLPISRQRKKQFRWQRDGKCQLCGEPAAVGALCVGHAVAQRERTRAVRGSVRRYNSKSYRLASSSPLPVLK